ncbi:hypothetical protein [Brevundimonas sp.]|uniref:hypothetical protein n=1 Tax=Brevundimonas sp. TaxID=1871086 RepID=UPI002737AC5A|nr:hypothetical protein [Brevundimonas sp.]MDP3803668.1 hypothetical protein [Brevundimonas sp.]
MADPRKAVNWRLFAIVALIDVVVGFGLVAAGLVGLLGEDGRYFALAGGGLVFAGGVIVLYARNKLSQVENRRGDLN